MLESGRGSLSASHDTTSVGLRSGAVDSICQRNGSSGRSLGIGLKTIGSIISAEKVLRYNPRARMTGHAIGEEASISKLTHQNRKSIPLDLKFRRHGTGS